MYVCIDVFGLNSATSLSVWMLSWLTRGKEEGKTDVMVENQNYYFWRLPFLAPLRQPVVIVPERSQTARSDLICWMHLHRYICL